MTDNTWDTLLDTSGEDFEKKKPKNFLEYDLTEKEFKFCIAYAELGNATEAARKAGYSGKNEGALRVTGCRLLKKEDVCKAINAIQEEGIKAAGLEKAEIISNLRLIVKRSLEEKKYKEATEATKLLGQLIGEFGSSKKAPGTVPSNSGESSEESMSNADRSDLIKKLHKLKG